MKYKNILHENEKMYREYTLQVKDLLKIIRDYDTEVDLVDVKDKTIKYKIKRGERYGSAFYNVLDLEVEYLTAVDHRTVEVGVKWHD